MKTILRLVALVTVVLFIGGQQRARAFLAGNGNPPVTVSFSNQDPTGGPVIITGGNFGDGANIKTVRVQCDVLAGGVVPRPPTYPNGQFLDVLSVTPTVLTVNARAYDAGTYSCRVENMGGSASVAFGQLHINSTTSPSAICTGSTIRGWYRTTDVLCSGVACNDGDLITQFTDLSGQGTHATCAGTARPTYHTVSTGTCNGVPCLGSQPVALFNGSTNVCNAAGTLGSTTNMAEWVVGRQIAHVASSAYAAVAAPSGTFFQVVDTSAVAVACAGVGLGGVTVNTGTPFQASFYNDTGTALKGCAVDNQVPNTTAASNAISGGNTPAFTIGGSNGVNTNAEIAEFVVCNVPYDATKWFNMAQYASLRYALPGPNPIAATNLGDNGGGLRVHGAQFVPGATIAVSGSVLGTTTATVNSSTSIQVVVPPGALARANYTATITNPDGSIGTLNLGVHVVSQTTDPNTICNGDGVFRLEGWWDSDDLTYQTCATAGCPSGTKISSDIDKSFFDADMIQATSGSQPVLTLADPAYTFAGKTHNSWTWDGTAAFFQTPILGNSVNPYGFWTLGIAKENGASSGILYGISGGAVELSEKWSAGSGKASCFAQSGAAGTATNAANINGVVTAVACDIPAGTNPTIGISLGNGAYTTTATTVTQVTSTSLRQDLGAFRNGGTYYKGTATQVIKLAANPGATILGKLETWAQGYNAP